MLLLMGVLYIVRGKITYHFLQFFIIILHL